MFIARIHPMKINEFAGTVNAHLVTLKAAKNFQHFLVNTGTLADLFVQFPVMERMIFA
jgi:hypothetical protein